MIVWHVGEAGTIDLLHTRDPIGCAVSVTICAFEVMARLGFTSFETWGWDGSYSAAGEDHASPQAHRGTDIENDVGGVLFRTTTSWCLEGQDAWNKLRDWPIVIHGGGMIGAIFDFQRSDGLDAPYKETLALGAIYLRNPEGGAKVAISEQEAQYDEANGRRFDPENPDAVFPDPVPLPPAPEPQWPNLVKLNRDGSVRQKPGRKAASQRTAH